MGLSKLEQLALMPKRQREAFVKGLAADEIHALAAKVWELVARPEQLTPAGGQWVHRWYLAGRGWGKTRTGAEFVHGRVRSGEGRRMALVGATAADVRDTMVEGESGILATARPGELPKYEPSKRRLTWPNGAIATTYTAEEPERLRGPQHDTWWCDEPGVWRYGVTVRDNLAFGARIGEHPCGVWTTTPRNVPLIREAIADGKAQARAIAERGGYWERSTWARSGKVWRTEPSVVMVNGTTYDNLHNLAESFANEILGRYENTRLGAQELLAQLLDDLGTFFQRRWFGYVEDTRQLPRTLTVVRFWDLAATAESEANPDPDWTAGAKVAIHWPTRTYYVLDVRRIRAMPGSVEAFIRETAAEDGKGVHIGLEQEPGSSGKSLVHHYRTHVLAGYVAKGYPSTGPKDARASVWAGWAESGHVKLLRARWNTPFLDECEVFDGITKNRPGYHDDQVDGVSGAFAMLDAGGPASSSGRRVSEARIPKAATRSR